MLIRNERPTHSRHSKTSIRLNWIDVRGVVGRHSSTLDCSRGMGEHGSPCMRIRTWWPPSVPPSPLPPPPLPWRHVWNHSKPYTPEKTILCLNSVSWPLRLRVCKSHPPQSAFHQRVSPTLLLIDLSVFYPSVHSTYLFLNSHHSLSAVGLVFLAWSYCCGHLHPLCPAPQASCFFLSCVFLSLLLTHQAGAVWAQLDY